MRLHSFALVLLVLSPVTQWQTANEQAIGAIHNARTRALAARTFAATIARLHHPAASVTPLADPARLAKVILADPRYQLAPRTVRPRPKSLIERALEWLWSMWQRFLDLLTKHVHLSRTGANVLGGILIGALALLLLYIALRFIGAITLERRSASATSETLATRPSARALYARSLEAAARGDYARAVALLFAACVLALDLRGVMHDDASATVGEFRRELRAKDASLVRTFDAIARPFTAAAYAERAVEQAEWAQAQQAFLVLLNDREPERA